MGWAWAPAATSRSIESQGFGTHPTRRMPMRVLTFCAGALVAVGMTRAGARAQNDPPPLHTENGIRDRLTVEAAETSLRGIDRRTNTALAPAGRYSYHRFLIGNTPDHTVEQGNQCDERQQHRAHIHRNFESQ